MLGALAAFDRLSPVSSIVPLHSPPVELLAGTNSLLALSSLLSAAAPGEPGLSTYLQKLSSAQCVVNIMPKDKRVNVGGQ